MGRKPCCSKEGLNRGAWNAHEDTVLVSYIKAHGEGHWGSLPIRAGLKRCGKSCRLRWLNYLRPGIKRGNISDDEEDLIIRLHKLLGNRWSLIAGRLPGRTDNEIKNYWNTTLAKRVQGRRQHCKPSKLTRPVRGPDGKKLNATVAAATAASAPAISSCDPRPHPNGADLIRTKALRCRRSFFCPQDDAKKPPKPAQTTAYGAACETDAVNGLLACAALTDFEWWGPFDDDEAAPQLGHPNGLEVRGAADVGLYSGDLTLDGWMENHWCLQTGSAFNAQSLDSLLDSEETYWA